MPYKTALRALRWTRVHLYEMMTALAIGWFGIVLLFLDATAFDTGKIFDPLSVVASQRVWGVVACAVALSLLISAFAGHLRLWRSFRRVSALSAMVWWAVLAALYTRGNHVSPNLGVYWALWIVSVWHADQVRHREP